MHISCTKLLKDIISAPNSKAKQLKNSSNHCNLNATNVNVTSWQWTAWHFSFFSFKYQISFIQQAQGCWHVQGALGCEDSGITNLNVLGEQLGILLQGELENSSDAKDPGEEASVMAAWPSVIESLSAHHAAPSAHLYFLNMLLLLHFHMTAAGRKHKHQLINCCHIITLKLIVTTIKCRRILKISGPIICSTLTLEFVTSVHIIRCWKTSRRPEIYI